MKLCKTCNCEKAFDLFYKDKSKPDGLHGQCKACRLLKVAEYREGNREELARKSRAYREENLEACRERERTYSLDNREARDAKVAAFHKKNPGKKAEYSARYRAKPGVVDRLNECARVYVNKRRKECNMYALRLLMRSRLYIALKSKGLKKNTRTFDALGCGPEDLVRHIENQFQDGMTWENRSEWHIDHIVPLATAKTEAEIYQLSHYTNLQPLWALDNIRKGARLDYCRD